MPPFQGFMIAVFYSEGLHPSLIYAALSGLYKIYFKVTGLHYIIEYFALAELMNNLLLIDNKDVGTR